MADDSRSPATKADIALLMNQIAKLYSAQEQWKREIIDRQAVWKEEIIRHLDLSVETIRQHFEGLKDRVARLERHTGLVAA